MKTVSALLIVLLLLAGCIAPVAPAPADAGEPAGSTIPAPLEEVPDEDTASGAQLSDEQLAGASYGGIYEAGAVTLSDNLYQGEPFVEGGATLPSVHLLPELTTRGDLDGDGVEDAIVVLMETSGGSGVFSYLSAQLNVDGNPVDTGAVLLGDRVGIQTITIEDGVVVVEMVTAGPEDPLCCPTLLVSNTYAMLDGFLMPTGSEELGTVEP